MVTGAEDRTARGVVGGTLLELIQARLIRSHFLVLKLDVVVGAAKSLEESQIKLTQHLEVLKEAMAKTGKDDANQLVHRCSRNPPLHVE